MKFEWCSCYQSVGFKCEHRVPVILFAAEQVWTGLTVCAVEEETFRNKFAFTIVYEKAEGIFKYVLQKS